MNKLPAGNFHSIDCAIQYSQAKQERARAKVKAKAIRLRKSEEKAARSKHRADLKRVNRSPRAEALKAAQLLARVSNADDNGYCTCVSCRAVNPWNSGTDGGHFIAKGASSYWSLDPWNIWPQCKPCNQHGMTHGTAAISYTKFMVDKFGQELVDDMILMAGTITKRNTAFYDDYIEKTKAQILIHKKRIGAIK